MEEARLWYQDPVNFRGWPNYLTCLCITEQRFKGYQRFWTQDKETRLLLYLPSGPSHIKSREEGQGCRSSAPPCLYFYPWTGSYRAILQFFAKVWSFWWRERSGRRDRSRIDLWDSKKPLPTKIRLCSWLLQKPQDLWSGNCIKNLGASFQTEYRSHGWRP